MKIYNTLNHRIGDKIVASGQLQYYKKTENILIIDPSHLNYFPIKWWFPDLFDYVVETTSSLSAQTFHEELSSHGYETLNLANLWISSPSLKKDTGHIPKMSVPIPIKDYIQNKYKPLMEFKHIIAYHCLTDAPYNVGRNHKKEQFEILTSRLEKYIIQNFPVSEFLLLPLPEDKNLLTVQECLGLISFADIFIGGDTGFSHAFAALKNDNPLIAIYGPNEHDVKAFHHEKVSGNYSSEWCSDPLSNNLTKFIMKDNIFDIDLVFETIISKLKKIKDES